MATNYTLPPNRKLFLALLAACALLFSSCSSFKKGIRYYQEGNYKKADQIFMQKMDHKTWDLAALFYHERIRLAKAQTLAEWQQGDVLLCGILDSLTNLQSPRKRLKLNKYRVNLKNVDDAIGNIQKSAIELVQTSGRISGLDTLLDHFPCWQNEPALKKLAVEMVNQAICCSPDSDRPEENCTIPNPFTIRYDDANRINKRHVSRIKPENWMSFLEINKHIWDIFRSQAAYCEMDAFREDHPAHPYTRDCWYDAAWQALCSDSLKTKLAFHADHPHNAFDYEICAQIICLGRNPDLLLDLDSAETERLFDIIKMASLQNDLCEGAVTDTIGYFQTLEELSRKYHEHHVMYGLVQQSIDYFLRQEQPEAAAGLIRRLSPIFPDQNVCPQGSFDFQVDKQAWFRRHTQFIEQPIPSEKERARPVAAWNTKENSEFSAISWGSGREVYFVRRDNRLRKNQILYSKSDGKKWSAPVPAPELNIGADVVPMTITNDGLWLLLRSEGKIYQSTRRETSMSWSKPELFPLEVPFASWAAFSADGKHLLVEGIEEMENPRKDIFLCKAVANGRFGKPEKLPLPINHASANNTRPYLAASGRLLYFTSDRPDGMGGTDIYTAWLSKPLEFSVPDSAFTHLDWRTNTIENDYSFSFVSEYSGKGLFHRPNLCENNLDIYEMQTVGAVKTPRTVRFAGIILDENGNPIPGNQGSFIEFLTDYNLEATKQVISQQGTYMYTAPEDARAVRLFPEIPGYYSERDTTHFPAISAEDQIIMDTFRLISFEYIRKNFTLKYGTFFHKTAEFDDKDSAYPEIVRLAKIARRMGADLVVMGHTDDSGTASENLLLSEQRAAAVQSFLVSVCGFDRRRITTKGFGATQPKCPNTTEEGRRCNRRIEIVFRMPELPGKG